MSEKSDNLLNLIKPYGLSEDEGIIYLYLLQNGFSTALALSRNLNIARTKIYRLLDSLKVKQLIEIRIQERGMQFGATHPSKIEQLLNFEQQQLVALQKNLPDLVAQLTSLLPQAKNQSKVLYYEGIEGLKQVTYNITKTKDVLRVFEVEHMSDFLPADFSENVRWKLLENKITTHDLTNKKFFPDFTQVSEFIKNYSHFRYIDPKELCMSFEALIYNDVYATYAYKDEQIFCVEIYNEQLAQMQKQIFDFIWNKAQVMHFTSEKGAASI